MKVLSFAALTLLFLGGVSAIGKDDKVSGLPGTSFNVIFDQYSGYLNAGNGGKWKFFYW